MTWWSRVWRRNKLEQDLGRELEFHIAERLSALKNSGMSEGEARRQVRQEFGGIEQVKEECRDARGTRWLDDLSQDALYALRTFRQKPGFVAVALLTIALGIGATTVMFTVLDGVLLKPLPYREPERLVSVYEQVENSGRWAFAYFNFLDCQRESRTLGQMAALRSGIGGTVSEPGDAEHVASREISHGLFSVLGIQLLHGRGFVADEDRPGAAPVAII